MLTIKLTASTTSDFCFFSPIPGAALLAQFIRPLYKCPVGVSNWVQTKASSCSNTFISSFLDFDERRKSSSFRPSSLDRILIQSNFSAKRFCTIESSLYPLGSYRKRAFILSIPSFEIARFISNCRNILGPESTHFICTIGATSSTNSQNNPSCDLELTRIGCQKRD